MIEVESSLVLCSSIVVERESRQRKEIKTEDLEDSIRRRGLMHPILLERATMRLVVGERRLTAVRNLGWEYVPARFVEDLSLPELKAIELEENIKREDFHWRDIVRGVGELHSLLGSEDPSWTQGKTGKYLGIEAGDISMILRVYRDLGNERLATAAGWRPAYNILFKGDERVSADILSDVLEDSIRAVERPVGGGSGSGSGGEGGSPSIRPAPTIRKTEDIPPVESILQEDFSQWVRTYQGQKFNLVHCDFPYGKEVFHGPQGGGGGWTAGGGKEAYRDSAEVYWGLLETFCRELDSFMAQSAHLVFWFSMDYYTETLRVMRELAPSLVVNPKPLVWVKSDNMGILPDHKRGPRQVYETALFASRGDRFIVKAVGNAIAAPTNKEFHPSTKPVPVLKHFFTMLVDENTRLLDPTCGGGSALRAAESLGAKATLGLEISPEYVENARVALRKDRILRRISK